jgi:hypothetical protein
MRTMRAAWMLGTFWMTGCATKALPPVVANAPRAAAPPSVEAPVSPPAPGDVPQGDDAKRAELLKARASFETFIARADGNPEYAAAVESAKLHIEDIDRVLTWLGDASRSTPGTPAP